MEKKIIINACRKIFARNFANVARACYNGDGFHMPMFHGACAVDSDYIYKRSDLFRIVRIMHGSDMADDVYNDLVTHAAALLWSANKLLEKDGLFIFDIGGAHYVNKYGF